MLTLPGISRSGGHGLPALFCVWWLQFSAASDTPLHLRQCFGCFFCYFSTTQCDTSIFGLGHGMALACQLLPLIAQRRQLPEVRSMSTFRAARRLQQLGPRHHNLHVVRGAPPMRAELLCHAACALHVIALCIARPSDVAKLLPNNLLSLEVSKRNHQTHFGCDKPGQLSPTTQAHLDIALVVRR